MMTLPTTEMSVIGPGGMSLGSMPLDMKSIPHVTPEVALGSIGPVELLHGFDALLGPPPLPNGFVFHGAQIDVMGGSYGRLQGLLQAGQQVGDFSVFAAVSGLYDNGFVPVSQSKAAQYHGDLGWRADGNEFHVKVHGVSNSLHPQEAQTVSGVTEVPYTSPNLRTQNSYQIDATGDFILDDGWVASTDLKFGHTKEFSETVVLGNTSSSGVLTTLANDTTSWGATGKLGNHGLLFGRPNNFAVGVNYNGGTTTDETHSYIGTLDGNYSFTSVTTELNGQNNIYPQKVKADTNYLDLYVADVLDVTDRLKVSVAGRFDFSQIVQYDLLGTDPAATGTHTFTHFSPSVGVTYAITPSLIAYGGYSEAAHVLTPSGLACDDMETPCSTKPSFFVTETVQQQSISHTYDFGFRGQLPTLNLPLTPVQVAWHAGAYRVDTSDDTYLYIDVNKPGRPVYYNVGDTRRQGFKAGIDMVAGRFTSSMIYTYTDATFRSPVTLYNPLNSAADAAGNIYVKSGDEIPLSPKHSLKVLAKYRVTDDWSVGASLRAVSSSYYSGDEVNAMQKLSGYFVASFNTQYRVNENLELFGLIENAFNAKYALFGALVSGGTTEQNPRWTRGQPLSVYGGFRWKFL